MALDMRRPFRASDAVRAGEVTWGVLRGPGFRRLDENTYVSSDVAVDPLMHVRAALVRAGTDGVATGWSACLVWELDVAPRVMPVELSTPGRRSWPAPGTVATRHRFADDEVTVVDGTRVTTHLRTAFDLATRAPGRPDGVRGLTDAVVAADALARAGGFTATDLARCAERHRGARGVRHVETVAALLDPRPDSPPESRTRVKLVLHGLPRPVVRHEIRDEIGILLHELDLAWPTYRVAVEYDGKDHTKSDRRGKDIDRLDALRRTGWIVIVVTKTQLARPSWVPDRAREALLERGWVPGPNPWAHLMGRR